MTQLIHSTELEILTALEGLESMPNISRTSRSHCSFIRCGLQNQEPFFRNWKCRANTKKRSKNCENAQWRSIFNADASNIPKYKWHSSSKSTSLGYWQTVASQTIWSRLHTAGLYAGKQIVFVTLTHTIHSKAP